MLKYMVTRLVSLIPTLLGVSLLVFLLTRLIPGDVVDVIIGTESQADPELMASMRAFFGIDQPLHVQYFSWMGKLLQGDLGTSWRSGMPVKQLILSRLAVTAELTLGAMLVALLVGIPLGVILAVRKNTLIDHIARVLGLTSLSLPIFWQAGMIILALSLWLRWSPPTNWVSPFLDPGQNVRMMFLPSLVLGTAVAATMMRLTRSALLESMGKDYVRTARSKGLSEPKVVGVHALRNALIVVITVAGVQVGYLLGGAVVTEEVFALPGLGRLVLQAIYQRDYPVVQACILFIALLFMLTNLLVDLAYRWIDPRITYN